ncbi:predicted protein [Nematostella vectensis]|uniref:Uncharacterized protein n=1 Tax=Nematostella vectensis TaxID=45351 RepID=A7S8G5_NEMVE|nr:predicted protein [Nematostella vectensis]|eukprot:XP_001632043.1 predicted protein [Nematostella vectensis]
MVFWGFYRPRTEAHSVKKNLTVSLCLTQLVLLTGIFGYGTEVRDWYTNNGLNYNDTRRVSWEQGQTLVNIGILCTILRKLRQPSYDVCPKSVMEKRGTRPRTEAHSVKKNLTVSLCLTQLVLLTGIFGYGTEVRDWYTNNGLNYNDTRRFSWEQGQTLGIFLFFFHCVLNSDHDGENARYQLTFGLVQGLQGIFLFFFHCVLNSDHQTSARRKPGGRKPLIENVPLISIASSSKTSGVTRCPVPLGTTREYLGTNRKYFGTTREYLGTTREDFGTTREYLSSTREYFGTNRENLCNTRSISLLLRSISVLIDDGKSTDSAGTKDSQITPTADPLQVNLTTHPVKPREVTPVRTLPEYAGMIPQLPGTPEESTRPPETARREERTSMPVDLGERQSAMNMTKQTSARRKPGGRKPLIENVPLISIASSSKTKYIGTYREYLGLLVSISVLLGSISLLLLVPLDVFIITSKDDGRSTDSAGTKDSQITPTADPLQVNLTTHPVKPREVTPVRTLPEYAGMIPQLPGTPEESTRPPETARREERTSMPVDLGERQSAMNMTKFTSNEHRSKSISDPTIPDSGNAQESHKQKRKSSGETSDRLRTHSTDRKRTNHGSSLNELESLFSNTEFPRAQRSSVSSLRERRASRETEKRLSKGSSIESHEPDTQGGHLEVEQPKASPEKPDQTIS